MMSALFLLKKRPKVECAVCDGLRPPQDSIKRLTGIHLTALVKSCHDCACCLLLLQLCEVVFSPHRDRLRQMTGIPSSWLSLSAESQSVALKIVFYLSQGLPYIGKIRISQRQHSDYVEIFTIEGISPDTRTSSRELFDRTVVYSGNHINLYTGQKIPWPTIRTARCISPVGDSPASMSLATTWISDCIANHPECLKVNGSYHHSTLPDRILCIKPHSDPFLFVNQEEKVGRYAALSHRWGDAIPLQLTNEALRSWQSGIPLLRFPRLFRDAIRVCRGLSIDYLWIDSLCIIQDSFPDWAKQSSKMSEIYSRAWVTIAADAASSSIMGFLDREPNMSGSLDTRIAKMKDHFRVPRFDISGQDEGFHSGSLDAEFSHSPPPDHLQNSIVFCRQHRKLSTKDGFHHHYEHSKEAPTSHLSNRGWTFQETLLSPRILHFMPEEMAWQCATLCRCECQIQPYYNCYTGSNEDDTVRPQDLEKDWDKVVSEYTGLELTFETDRLAALAGLASRAHQFRQDQRYLAGLWENDLLESLLWTADTRSDAYAKTKRIRPAIAPSWSWASVTGRITFDLKKAWGSHPCGLQDLQIHYPVSQVNTYGSVTGGCLTVTAQLFSIRLTDIRYTFSEYHIANLQILDGSDRGMPAIQESAALVADSYEDLSSMERGEELAMVNLSELSLFLLLRKVRTCDTRYYRMGLLVLNPTAAIGLVLPSAMTAPWLSAVLSVSARALAATRRVTIL